MTPPFVTALLALLLSLTAALAARPLPQAPAVPAPPAAVADQQFTAGDVTLRYRDTGSGAPVVLIHGYTASLESMGGVAKVLAGTHRVVALDVRGFGRSSKFSDPARFGQLMVDDVVRLMDHLRIDRAHLVGHSMGALIAANVAARHAARVTSATLVAGPFYESEARFAEESARWVKDLESGAGLTNFLAWLFPAMKPEMAAMASAGSMKMNDHGSLVAVMKSLPALAITRLPAAADRTLLVAGTGDPLHPLSVGLAKRSPGARLVEVAGADHLNVITAPAAVAALRERVGQ